MTRKENFSPQNRESSGKRLGGVPPVEHRFKPGQNGNPGGRTERDIAADIARAIFAGATRA